MSNEAKQPVVRVLNGEGQEAQREVEALQARIEEMKAQQKKLKEKTKGMSITLNEYIHPKSGEKRVGVSIKGLSMKPVNLYAEQVLRLLGDTPEAQANREALKKFIEDNKTVLTWKK